MQTSRHHWLPDGWHAGWVLLAWTVPAALGIPFTLVSRAQVSDAPALWRSLLIVGACWLVWAPLSMLVATLVDRVPLVRPWRVRALTVHALAALGACAVQAVAAAAASHWLTPTSGVTFAGTAIWWAMLLTPGGVLVYAAVAAFRSSQRQRARADQHAREVETLAARLAEARLAALRAQLRPHFLFNTLNAVVALVRDGERTAAVEALLGVSRLLRATLDGDARHEIPLQDELAFIREYLRLEQLRIGERLRVRYDVPARWQHVLVPSLVLQPLVENAVRHGVARVSGPVLLSVTAHADAGDLILTVCDTGAGLREDPPLGGVGLRNVRERLAQLHGAHASLEIAPPPDGRGVIARVRLPLAPRERAA
ncbi:MAG: histidine kinase [Gemmatimonadaceae bacterium]|jgi:sensor histidine kinase YesM|nr:histidine kinase [Gemmatimonadaceae bacterium]